VGTAPAAPAPREGMSFNEYAAFLDPARSARWARAQPLPAEWFSRLQVGGSHVAVWEPLSTCSRR
jgi:hypothetical protein